MAEDRPLPDELPAPALEQPQCQVLWVEVANDGFGTLVITRQANREGPLATQPTHSLVAS